MGNQKPCSGCGNTGGYWRWYCSNCGSYWCMHCTGKKLSFSNDSKDWVKCTKCGSMAKPQ